MDAGIWGSRAPSLFHYVPGKNDPIGAFERQLPAYGLHGGQGLAQSGRGSFLKEIHQGAGSVSTIRLCDSLIRRTYAFGSSAVTSIASMPGYWRGRLASCHHEQGTGENGRCKLGNAIWRPPPLQILVACPSTHLGAPALASSGKRACLICPLWLHKIQASTESRKSPMGMPGTVRARTHK